MQILHPTLNLRAPLRIAHARSVEKIVGNETAKFAESESEGEPDLDDISYPGKAAKAV